jgi:predicted nuclease of predicted toxin-antitoxin system
VSEIRPGADDEEVLARAVREGRVLLTFDRDYGRLLFQEGKPAPVGVAYLRFVPETPTHPAKRIARLIEQAEEVFEGSYLVISTEGVRRRPLPGADR